MASGIKKYANPGKRSWAIFLVLSAAFLFRLYRLGSNDLWYDEVCSVFIGQKFWHTWNPPFYFMLLHYWIKIFGVSEFALRMPSAIFSLLSVYTCFALGKRVYNFKTGILASGLMGLSALHLWYAQEARPYSLVVLLGLASTYFFWQSLTNEKKRGSLLYILSTTLLLYCDITYFSFFLVAAQIFSALIFFRRFFLRHALFYCLAPLLFLPQTLGLIYKFCYIKKGFWIPNVNAGSFFITLENFNLGYNMWPMAYRVSLLLSGGLLIACLLSSKKEKTRSTPTGFMVILCFAPISSILIISKLFFPLYLDRGLMLFSPYYYILLACGICYLLSMRGLRTVIVPVLIYLQALSLICYFNNCMISTAEHHTGVHLKKPLKHIINFINDRLGPNDIIAHTNYTTALPFIHYRQGATDNQYYLFAPGMIDTNWNRPFRETERCLDVTNVKIPANGRLWVISCDWPRDLSLDKNSISVLTELFKRYTKDLDARLDGVWIFRFKE